MNKDSDNSEEEIKKTHNWRLAIIPLMLLDAFAFSFSYFVALWVRFDCRYSTIPSEYLNAFYQFIPFYILVAIIVFYLFNLYKSLWRFVSYSEILRIILASVIAFVFHAVVISSFYHEMPIVYFAFGFLLQTFFVVATRFSYSFTLFLRDYLRSRGNRINAMIIGAGSVGQLQLRDIRYNNIGKEKVVCFIDDDPDKKGRYIEGVIVEGNRDCILEACEKYEISKIYFAIPSASIKTRRDILSICKETECELMIVPGVHKLNGNFSVDDAKHVSIEDLLGRSSIKVNGEEILEEIKDKVVLVTGGGGSIGSELARQIASRSPKTLVLFDIYENNVYDIQLELKKKYPNLHLEALIGSVRDIKRVNQVFAKFHPDIVYHAAAHKHVPLMEDSPCEAVKNNAFGTHNVAISAVANGCKKFVLISTDKAVNPTNVMGATKRICEMVIQTINELTKHSTVDNNVVRNFATNELISSNNGIKTDFVAVRFGNVLGSNGSVIPLFKKQIEEGGPITVTHPDVVRYFMTIPEAVGLVMQAGYYAKGGEIYVLDMGEPVKIDTLARNLINLSGYKPDVDIKVEYIGLRPGEKLYEEKLMSTEGLKKTDNELIYIGNPVPFDTDEFIRKFKDLIITANNNSEDIRPKIADIVKTYHYEQ